MLRVSQIRLGLDQPESQLPEIAARKLRIPPGQISEWQIVQKSIDARKKSDVHFTYTLRIALQSPRREAALLNDTRLRSSVRPEQSTEWQPPAPACFGNQPVIVGAGPAGLFAALVLAEAGARPLLLERGTDVDTRCRIVEDFWSAGRLQPQTNVQFGEGGAGAFSDGKLTTGTHDHRNRKVLQELAAAGAPQEILYLAKPHVGTDILRGVVKNLRRRIIALGGEVRFEHQLTGITTRSGRVTGAIVDTPAGSQQIPTDNILLAIGHSSRDTFHMLHSLGVAMQPKPFAVGVRIEHLQAAINAAQYGSCAGHPNLPPADYKLVEHLPNGRSVYTFCMCPGGSVVAAASEQGGIVTNGMSLHSRDGVNANAALLVSVTPDDFPDGSALGGVALQRQIERSAFLAAQQTYAAPCQTIGTFLNGSAPGSFGSVLPSYRPGVTPARLDTCLPGFVTDSLRQALPRLDGRLHGFAHPDALLTAPETRSSSPVRLLRDDTMQSVGLSGLYPCGEGAGYAGGIVSAAADGIRVAEAILNNNQRD
ncbi:MAG: FAD-dependent oxidoreductase [Firmicutes bacterium]|nr:FAD-dependent oxidoreductase [Bacillota bacterium]